jgi:phospholipid/cholesterol/gamma-HCH transport system ATP-binding protein
MSETPPILVFENVSAATDYDLRIEAMNLELGPGGLGLVRAEHDGKTHPLHDLAEGLVAPESGAVRFLGRSWTERSPEQAAADRGRVGRFFEGAAWISNLDVDENITLAQRHHTRRPPDEIYAEAAQRARAFGLDELPRVRPAWAARHDLRVAQWVRALMGQPALLLLDFPTEGFSDSMVGGLLEALSGARSRGAAVLLVTSEDRIWRHAGLETGARWRVEDGCLRPAPNEGI